MERKSKRLKRVIVITAIVIERMEEYAEGPGPFLNPFLVVMWKETMKKKRKNFARLHTSSYYYKF
jgi:hypothetical protein